MYGQARSSRNLNIIYQFYKFVHFQLTGVDIVSYLDGGLRMISETFTPLPKI